MCQVILIAADLDTITVSAEKSNAIMLVFCSLVSLVRNSVVLAVYLLFSVACFFTVHEHLFIECHLPCCAVHCYHLSVLYGSRSSVCCHDSGNTIFTGNNA